jgi:hypothetical protein
VKPKLDPHDHKGDGIPDHRGEDRCLTCKLGPRHEIHQPEAKAEAIAKRLPPVPQHVRDETARRLGEYEGEER